MTFAQCVLDEHRFTSASYFKLQGMTMEQLASESVFFNKRYLLFSVRRRLKILSRVVVVFVATIGSSGCWSAKLMTVTFELGAYVFMFALRFA